MPAATHISLLSPDGRVEIRFALEDWHAEGQYFPAAPLWQVWFAGRQMLRRSRVGTFQSFVGDEFATADGQKSHQESPEQGSQSSPLQFVIPRCNRNGGRSSATHACNDHASFVVKAPGKEAAGFEVLKIVRHRCRKTWQPVFGDAASLDDHHNELVVRLRERATPNRRLDFLFRCSNQGAAVRVRVPRQRGLARVTPTGAGAVYRFPENTLGWITAGEAPAATADFHKVALHEMALAPLTLNFTHGKLACLLQVGGDPLCLKPTLDGLAVLPVDEPIEVTTPYESPWQVLLLGDKPCDLPQNSAFLLNLGAAIARKGSAPADGPVVDHGATLPFVRYPLWLAGSTGGPRVPPRGQTALAIGESTPAHCLAFELICGIGAVRWDETIFLRGAIGEFAVVARRLGRVWQVAGITGAEGRILTVRLEEVLRDGTDGTYALTIQRDPLPGETAEGGLVRETFHGVDALDKPRLELVPRGGFLLRLEPEN